MDGTGPGMDGTRSLRPSAMGDAKPSFVRRHLDPTDEISEVLFGVVMALTITLGAGLVVAEGEDATRQLLIGVLGCNVAWGLIDAAMYVMGCVLERSRRAQLVQSVRDAPSEERALGLIADELDEQFAHLVTATERDRLYRKTLERVKALPLERPHVEREDLLGAVAVFWLVSLSSLPAALPFLVLDDRFLALRLSNLLLLATLFVAGWRWARATGGVPWRFGARLVLIGLALVAIAIALGG